jgi:hypothetical protein
MRMHEIMRESIPSLPVKRFKALWHVGAFDANQKQHDSHEGAGLSVSVNPDEWRHIARGRVGGSLWELTKAGNAFIDAHRISKKQRRMVGDWAVQNGFADYETVYRVSYYDDELEDEVYEEFTDREQAEIEAEEKDSEVQEIKGELVATDALRKRTMSRADQVLTFDLILSVYAEEHGYDGVWWNDMLDVSRYSAPRGVIAPSKVHTWTVKNI